jgi:hypothetical protein
MAQRHISLSVTPTASTSPLAQDNTSRGFPPCVPSRANPSGLGHAATILLVGPETPRVRNADKFELKILEKLNRKAIRNSLEKEKAFSAQLAQLGPARPRARPRGLIGGPHLSATACAHVLLPPLSPTHCQWGRSVGADSLTLTPILSRCPMDPFCQC